LEIFEKEDAKCRKKPLRRPEDFLFMFGVGLMDFDVEKIKNYIINFQIIKWRRIQDDHRKLFL
jgi:hypothetical protein